MLLAARFFFLLWEQTRLSNRHFFQRNSNLKEGSTLQGVTRRVVSSIDVTQRLNDLQLLVFRYSGGESIELYVESLCHKAKKERNNCQLPEKSEIIERRKTSEKKLRRKILKKGNFKGHCKPSKRGPVKVENTLEKRARRTFLHGTLGQKTRS